MDFFIALLNGERGVRWVSLPFQAELKAGKIYVNFLDTLPFVWSAFYCQKLLAYANQLSAPISLCKEESLDASSSLKALRGSLKHFIRNILPAALLWSLLSSCSFSLPMVSQAKTKSSEWPSFPWSSQAGAESMCSNKHASGFKVARQCIQCKHWGHWFPPTSLPYKKLWCLVNIAHPSGYSDQQCANWWKRFLPAAIVGVVTESNAENAIAELKTYEVGWVSKPVQKITLSLDSTKTMSTKAFSKS